MIVEQFLCKQIAALIKYIYKICAKKLLTYKAVRQLLHGFSNPV